MSIDGQGTKCRKNIAENFNRLSRVHDRNRQTDDRQTDRRAIAYSEQNARTEPLCAIFGTQQRRICTCRTLPERQNVICDVFDSV